MKNVKFFFSLILALGLIILFANSRIAFANQGDPDNFGYQWTDSKFPPPTINYSWIDIWGSGTSVGSLGDNDEYGPINIGFTFNFYGNNYTQLYIGNNGALLFSNQNLPSDNRGIPNTNNPDNIIAPFWDDLDRETGSIYYQTLGSAPNRYLVVQYEEMNHYQNSSGTISFEVILYEITNAIKFQYEDVYFGSSAWDEGGSATVGIENEDGTIGVQYSYNSEDLQNNMAIELKDLPPLDITTLTAQDTPSDTGGSIYLDWSDCCPPADFNHYNIYRELFHITDVTGLTPINSSITDPFTTEYTDSTTTDGIDYYYAVTAVDNAGNEDKTVTDAGPVQSSDNIPPLAPTGLTVQDNPNDEGERIRLSWNDNSESDLREYKIYRSVFSGPLSSKSYIATVTQPTTMYIDDGLSNGTIYYYQITAVDTSDNESPGSPEANAYPIDNTPPPSITTELTAEDTPSDQGGSIDLDWSDYNAPPDFKSYNIYKSDVSSFSIVAPSLFLYSIFSSTTTTYTDSPTIDGTDYWYAVTCVDTSDNEDTSVISVGPVTSREDLPPSVNFIDPLPNPSEWQDSHNVTCQITVVSTSTVDTSSIKYKISSTGPEEIKFSPWQDSGIEIVSTSGNSATFRVNITNFQEGSNNYIKWKCMGVESKSKYQIKIDVNTPPSKPKDLTPKDASEVTLSSTLKWTESADPDEYFNQITYTLELSEDANFPMKAVIPNLPNNNYSLNMLGKFLQDNTIYYWRVEAIDNHGTSSGYSDIASFFFNSQDLAPQITIIQPGDGVNTSRNPVIEAKITDDGKGINPNSIQITIEDNSTDKVIAVIKSSDINIYDASTGTVFYIYKERNLIPGMRYKLTIYAEDMAYGQPNSSSESVIFEVSSFGAIADIVPYPSPFDPMEEDITFKYVLEEDSRVTINLYDMAGRLVKTLIRDEEKSSGEHNEDTWDGANFADSILANGIYICELIVENGDGEHRRYVTFGIFGK